MTAGGPILLAVATSAASVLVALAYWSGDRDDPGLTTEIALIVTVMLGGLALENSVLAAAIGVAAAILLATRTLLHGFVKTKLSESELRDGLILAAATFIILPLLPNQPIDPFGAINPRNIWTIAILVMAISGAGYVAERLLGPRYGLPAAGFASGFVSSTATIGAMGSRVRQQPTLLIPASVGAILSTVATVVQLAIVLAATSLQTLWELAPALALAGGAAVAYSIAYGLKRSVANMPAPTQQKGRAFSPYAAILFAAILAVVLLATAVVDARYGSAGLAVTTALAGLVDAHSPAIAVATLVATGHIRASDAVLPIMAAFTTNSIGKIGLAVVSGGPRFAVGVVPGLVLTVVGLWLGGIYL